MGMSGLYGHHGLAQRPESASSASPPSHGHFPASPPSHGHFPAFPPATSAAGMLVVPQPINASKVNNPPQINICFYSIQYELGFTLFIYLSFFTSTLSAIRTKTTFCSDVWHGRRGSPGPPSPPPSHERRRRAQVPVQDVSSGKEFVIILLYSKVVFSLIHNLWKTLPLVGLGLPPY